MFERNPNNKDIFDEGYKSLQGGFLFSADRWSRWQF